VERFFSTKDTKSTMLFSNDQRLNKFKENRKDNTKEIINSIRNGKRAIYLTGRHPSLYSTWIYIYREITNAHKGYRSEVITGHNVIFSFFFRNNNTKGEGERYRNIPHVTTSID
jgi:precorrin-2 methylase